MINKTIFFKSSMLVKIVLRSSSPTQQAFQSLNSFNILSIASQIYHILWRYLIFQLNNLFDFFEISFAFQYMINNFELISVFFMIPLKNYFL